MKLNRPATPFTETEILLAILENDNDRAKTLIADLDYSERSFLRDMLWKTIEVIDDHDRDTGDWG
jgi:hypothetical protein